MFCFCRFIFLFLYLGLGQPAASLGHRLSVYVRDGEEGTERSILNLLLRRWEIRGDLRLSKKKKIKLRMIMLK